MIEEFPGRFRQSAMLLREALKRRFSRPQPKPFTVERFAADFQRRLSEPAFEWSGERFGATKRVLIPILPWLSTPVPFFSIELGRALAADGCEISFLWDPENVFLPACKPLDIRAIEQTVSLLNTKFRVVSLPLETEPLTDRFDHDLHEIFSENAVRYHGGESYAQPSRQIWKEKADAVRMYFFRILALLGASQPDFLVLPGGVFGVSGLFSLACRVLQIEYSTYDCGPGELVVAHDSAAAHLEDIGRAYADLRDSMSSSEITALVQHAEAVLAQRRTGTDAFRLQPPSSSSRATYDLFVPLNFRVDTAALQRQKLFSDVQDWIRQLLDWVANQDDVTVVIRQHPCERIPMYRGTDDWHAFLRPFRNRLRSRLRFVSAWDQVNSYDLIANAKVALPYTSRIGIECAYFGLPTILCARCFYGQTDFVQAPSSAIAYFQAISDGLAGKNRPSPSQRENAALFYALVESTALAATLFTPAPEDYVRWVAMTPHQLRHQQSVKLIVKCLRERSYFPSLLYHRRRGLFDVN
jgi:hypothetical protein